MREHCYTTSYMPKKLLQQYSKNTCIYSSTIRLTNVKIYDQHFVLYGTFLPVFCRKVCCLKYCDKTEENIRKAVAFLKKFFFFIERGIGFANLDLRILEYAYSTNTTKFQYCCSRFCTKVLYLLLTEACYSCMYCTHAALS